MKIRMSALPRGSHKLLCNFCLPDLIQDGRGIIFIRRPQASQLGLTIGSKSMGTDER